MAPPILDSQSKVFKPRDKIGRLRQRPIAGGVFGEGRFTMASQVRIERGLHAVRYFVLDGRGGSIVSSAEVKALALQHARRVLTSDAAAGRINAEQLPLFAELPLRAEILARRRGASRRRRAIFEKSEGKCAYCTRPLTLDGKWHVEHQMPRALGGTDAESNLVAACETCNLSKSDRTAIEFLAQQSDRG